MSATVIIWRSGHECGHPGGVAPPVPWPSIPGGVYSYCDRIGRLDWLLSMRLSSFYTWWNLRPPCPWRVGSSSVHGKQLYRASVWNLQMMGIKCCEHQCNKCNKIVTTMGKGVILNLQKWVKLTVILYHEGSSNHSNRDPDFDQLCWNETTVCKRTIKWGEENNEKLLKLQQH